MQTSLKTKLNQSNYLPVDPIRSTLSWTSFVCGDQPTAEYVGLCRSNLTPRDRVEVARASAYHGHGAAARHGRFRYQVRGGTLVD